MQPSIFNVRVPLRDQSDVFLMNTLTDAQIIVPPEVVSLLDSIEGRTQPGYAAARAFDDEEREALATLTELGFVVESHDADRRALDAYFDTIRHDTVAAAPDGADHAAVQLRLRLLLSGRSRRLQQARRQDVARDGGAVSRTGSSAQLDAVRPETLVLTFFGGEPLLNLPVIYYLAERRATPRRRRAACRLTISIITNGLLLTPEVVDRLLPYGLQRRQDHARRRPRHPQPHAAAARRPGHLRQIIENVRARRRQLPISIGGNFDETSVDSYPALLDFLREQDFADSSPRSTSSRSSRAVGTGGSAEGHHPADRRRGHGKPLNGTCMTVARAPASPARPVRLAATSLDETMGFLREETQSAASRPTDGVHRGRARSTVGTRTRSAPTARSTRAPASPASHSSTGHIDGRHDVRGASGRASFDRLGPARVRRLLVHPRVRRRLPVASHTELGDMDTPAVTNPVSNRRSCRTRRTPRRLS